MGAINSGHASGWGSTLVNAGNDFGFSTRNCRSDQGWRFMQLTQRDLYTNTAAKNTTKVDFFQLFSCWNIGASNQQSGPVANLAPIAVDTSCKHKEWTTNWRKSIGITQRYHKDRTSCQYEEYARKPKKEKAQTGQSLFTHASLPIRSLNKKQPATTVNQHDVTS